MFKNVNDFTADKFTPTKWESAEQKARFAKQFIKFVESDFAMREFPQAFYLRLALSFGHIAHYNLGGFFQEFFTTTEDKMRFLRMTLEYPCYGDSDYTFADVEKALQHWMNHNGILGKYERKLEQEIESNERRELVRLQAKYRE